MSAFSTWEKELHKIVFDPRYLLLSPEERKQVSHDGLASAHISLDKRQTLTKLQTQFTPHLHELTIILLLEVLLF